MLIAIILGLIQGLTEFIPVSSTAHLTLAGTWLGLIDTSQPERWTAFIATIQLGTLAAVFVYFRRDIVGMTKAFFAEVLQPWRIPPAQWSMNARMCMLVLIGTVPIVTIGLAFKKLIEGPFTKDPLVIAVGLIFVGILLWIAELKARFDKRTEDITRTDAVLIGLAQVMALIPGASRSGSTIMAGLFRGLNREDAARFSFLLSIPAIAGAGILEFVGELKHLSLTSGGPELIVATLTALVSGYLSIAFLLRYLRTRSTNVFVLYRILLGLALIVSGCTQPAPEPILQEKNPDHTRTTPVVQTKAADTVSATITKTVEVKTSMGSFTIGLYGEDAPLTVTNFLTLVQRRYYNRTLVHRVVPGFVIQMGDPKTKDPSARSEWGKGGVTATGSPLPEEIDERNPSVITGYKPGVVAMARKTESGSGTSQFFICLEDAMGLPLQYTIFGRIVKGMDVVEAISHVDVEPGVFGSLDAVPKKPVVIHSIRIVPTTRSTHD